MNCYVCGSPNFYTYKDFSTLHRVTSDAKPFRKGGNLAHCLKCGFVQKILDSQMSQELEEIYSNYTPYHQSNNDTQTIFIEGNPISRCRFLLNNLKPFIKEEELRSVLDFGCGSGSFLKEINKDLPEVDLYAFDLNDKNAENLNSLSSFKKFFTGNYQLIKQKFSLITLIHSLEHIPNPREILDFIRENLLEEGGYLFIQVPNIEKNSFDLLVADHLSHFTPESLSNFTKFVGFKRYNKTHNWIEKEISFLLKKDKVLRDNIIPTFSYPQSLPTEIGFFHSLLETALLATKTARSFGIFGTSISSTWLAGALEGKVDFFTDEDSERIGRMHLGKPILDPQNVLEDSYVFFPFYKELRTHLQHKHAIKKWKFTIDSALYN